MYLSCVHPADQNYSTTGEYIAGGQEMGTGFLQVPSPVMITR